MTPPQLKEEPIETTIIPPPPPVAPLVIVKQVFDLNTSLTQAVAHPKLKKTVILPRKCEFDEKDNHKTMMHKLAKSIIFLPIVEPEEETNDEWAI